MFPSQFSSEPQRKGIRSDSKLLWKEFHIGKFRIASDCPTPRHTNLCRKEFPAAHRSVNPLTQRQSVWADLPKLFVARIF
jgi:hypothetical protein